MDEAGILPTYIGIATHDYWSFYWKYPKVTHAVCCAHLRVDFDNNLAERDLRNIKVKVKVSGCFRTDDGAREYLRIMLFIGTARKHGKNAYEAIVHALSGDLDYIFC